MDEGASTARADKAASMNRAKNGDERDGQRRVPRRDGREDNTKNERKNEKMRGREGRNKRKLSVGCFLTTSSRQRERSDKICLDGYLELG